VELSTSTQQQANQTSRPSQSQTMLRLRTTQSMSEATMEPSSSTDTTTTNRTFGTIRKKPLTGKNVFAAVLLLVFLILTTLSYTTSLLTNVQNQAKEDANRNVLPKHKSVPEKKDTSASVLLHDDVVSQTTEIMKANGTVLLKHKSVPEKKDTLAPAVLLHDDVARQTTEINKANMALEKKESIPNRVTHLMKKPEFQVNDAYSGMWWVSPVSP
jgi:hypothetical protein